MINLNDPLEEEPDYNTLPDIGILGKIKSKIDLPNGITRVVMTGIDRVEIVSINNNNDFCQHLLFLLRNMIIMK